MGHEVAVDGVAAEDGGLNEGLHGELVDAAGPAVGGLEQALDSVLGEELGVDLGALEVKLDVVARVLEGEGERPSPLSTTRTGCGPCSCS